MQKTLRLLISFLIACQITGFFMGIILSNQACREGIMPFSEMIDKKESDKIALLSSILIYHGFKAGANTVNSFRECGRIMKSINEK